MLAASLLQQHQVGLLQDGASTHTLHKVHSLRGVIPFAGGTLLATSGVVNHGSTLLLPLCLRLLGQLHVHLLAILLLILVINEEGRAKLSSAIKLAILGSFSFTLSFHLIVLAFVLRLPESLGNQLFLLAGVVL